MSLRLLVPTGSRSRISGIAAAVVLLWCSFGAAASAQGSAWQLLDFGLDSGFRNAFEWPTAGSTLYFIDSLRGYYYPENEMTPSVRTFYATTDGGRTWSTLPAFVPVPQRMIDASFGISSSGWLTRDAGAAWQRIRPVLDPTFSYYGTSVIAGSPQHLIALSQPFETDATTGQLGPIGPNRLTTSTNGGVTWTSVDSMVVETIAGSGERKLELYDSTGFGDLPAPADMTDTFSVSWYQLYGMPDTLSASVATVAYGRVGGRLENHYYIGRLNLRTMTAAWTKLPFVDVTPTTTIRPPGIEFITPLVGYAVQTSTVNNVTTYTYWRTINGGQSWTNSVLPSWIDLGSLRFLSPQLGIALNAITTDGGATWNHWAHPFEGGMFYAPDSAHYFVANRWSLFARSDDAGHTWQRNESGAVPRTISANSGRIVVGRNYRSILASTDRGVTWRDADLEGSVPAAMSTVWAITMPDSVIAPNRFIGVASMISYANDTSLAVIESIDGGLNWTVSSTLPGTKAPGGPVLIDFSEEAEMASVGMISTGRRLYISNDDGRTWALRDTTLYYQALELSSAQNTIQVNAPGIYQSPNAGQVWTRTQTLPSARNRALGLQAFSPTSVRVLFPDRTRRNVYWNVGTSTDGGVTWTIVEYTGAPRPLDGYAFWRDADTVYAVGRGATFQRSTDGGASFSMLKDSSVEFRALGSWIAAGKDEQNIYVAGAGDAIGRWEFAAPPPPVSVPLDLSRTLAARLVGNVTADRAVLELSVERASRVSIDVVDVVGRTVIADAAMVDAGARRIAIDVAALAAGGYFVRVSDGNAVTVLPLKVTR